MAELRRRWLRPLSSILVAAMTVALVVTAVNAGGFANRKVILQDEGVWIVRKSNSSLVYLSKASGQAEVSINVSQLTGQVMLTQSAPWLLAQDDPLVRGEVIDGRTGAVAGEVQTLPAGAVLAHSGPTVAALEPSTGKVWVAKVESAPSVLSQADAAPTLKVHATVSAAAAVAVGTDGAVHVVSTADQSIQSIDAQGRVGSPRHLSSATAGKVQVSTAGPNAVVLDTETKALVLPSGRSVDLSGHGDHPILQQPSADADAVLVATDSELVQVAVGSGRVTVLKSGAPGGPIPPVRYFGNSYAAWQQSPTAIRINPDGSVRNYPIGRESQRLVWQVGNRLVALNDLDAGTSVFQLDDKLITLGPKDLDRAIQKKESKNDSSSSTGQNTTTQVTDQQKVKQQVPPEPVADTQFGARVGRTSAIPVLANDKDANGDVLVVTKLSADLAGKVTGGTAGIVAAGTEVAFTPDSTADGSLTYTVSDGIDEATAPVSIKVYPADGSGGADLAPKRIDSSSPDAAIQVGLNSPFEANLLRGWFDPEGDAFSLAAPPKFEPDTASSWFTVDPTGRIAGQGYAAGQVTLTFDVVDQYGQRASGKFVIDVAPDAKVKTFPDTIVARVGETAVADVLANDIGADLRVGAVKSSSDAVRAEQIDAGLRVAVKASAPGQYLLDYEVRQASASVTAEPEHGQIRVVVPDPKAPNLPPVTAPDVVYVQPGVPSVVDVLRNDSDPNADVLVVTGAQEVTPGSVEVRTIDNQFVRVLVQDFPPTSSSLEVRYTISDGTSSTQGVLLVARDPFGGDRPPTLRDDVRSVRAEGTITIPVLANDSSSGAGLRLRTSKPITPGAGGGQWLVAGDKVTFVAPATAGRATATYHVEGSSLEGHIVVNVTPKQSAGVTLDQLPDVTVRVIAGHSVVIPLPLDADPDGDALVLQNFTPSSKALGVVGQVTDENRNGGFLVYTAESTKSGLDHIDYTVEEQHGNKPLVPGRVWIGVAKADTVRDLPIANPDQVWIKPGETRTIDVLANDTPVGVTLASVDPIGAEFGKATQVGQSLVYTAPATPQERTQILRYRAAFGGNQASGTVTVFISASRPNIPPTVTNGTVRVAVGGSGSFDVLKGADDPDGDRTKLQLEPADPATFPPAPANVKFENGIITMTAAAQSAPVFFKVVDPDGGEADGFVNFLVEDRAPVRSWKTVEVDGDRPQTVDVAKFITDPDAGDTWGLAATDPVGGAVSGVINNVQGTVVTFTPNADAVHAQFAVTVKDSQGKSATLVFDFVVRTNRPPDPPAINLAVPSKGINPPIPVTIDPNDPDPTDQGKHVFDGPCTAPEGFIATQGPGLQVTITTTKLLGATAKVQCTIRDTRDKTGVAVINVTVGATDRARPTANPLSFDVKLGEQGGQAQTLPVPYDDPLGEGVTAIFVSQPAKATAAISKSPTGWIITVTPPQTGVSGLDSFTYRVTDAEQRSSEATVSVVVEGSPKQPGKPAPVAGDQTITVSWPPSPSNGVPVDYYEVTPSIGQPLKVQGVLSATFNNLTNGTNYSFTVKACPATASWGCSPDSVPVSATPDRPPATPLNFVATRGDTVVDLAWDAVDFGGSPGAQYIVSCDKCGGVAKVINAGTTSTQWTGLTNGTVYQFSVVSQKVLQSTGAVAASTPITATAKPAGAPLALVVNAPTSDQAGNIVATWAAADPNGEPVDAYTATLQPAAGTCVVSSLSATCTGVPVGTSVRVSVTAHNVVGTGPAGLSAPVVAAVPPDAPTVTSLQGNGSSAAIAFTVANSGGVTLTNVEVARNGVALGAQPYVPSVNVPTPVGASYTFQVRVQNQSGFWSPWSTTTRAVAGQGVPTIGFSGSAGSNTLTWSWVVGANFADAVSVTVDGIPVGLSANGQLASPVACNGSQTRTISVSYSWDGVARPAVTQQATAVAAACPPRVVTTSRGTVQGTCSVAPVVVTCYYVVINIANFTPGPHPFVCFGGAIVGTPGKVYQGTITALANGTASVSTRDIPPFCSAANQAAAQIVVEGVGDSGAAW